MGIDRWFSDVGLAEMWRRDFEGGVVARFRVREKYTGEFIYLFIFQLWINYNDASNRSMFALIPKLTGQPE